MQQYRIRNSQNCEFNFEETSDKYVFEILQKCRWQGNDNLARIEFDKYDDNNKIKVQLLKDFIKGISDTINDI